MDVLSHLLIGEALALPSQTGLKNNLLVAGFSVLPDLMQIPLYLRVGFLNRRLFWLPKREDWFKNNFRPRNPGWAGLWDVPHSLFFAALVVAPLVWFLHLPKMAAAAYLLHIFTDLLTHTGEWSVKIFYPFQFKAGGFTDAWAWKYSRMALAWLALGALILLAGAAFRRF